MSFTIRARRTALLVLLAIQGIAHAQTRAGFEAPQSVRAASFELDTDWRFVLVNDERATDPTGAYERAYEPGYDDSRWRRLDLPHDWSIERDPRPDRGTSAGSGFLPGGLAWYRKTFLLPRHLDRTRISVEFDGIYMDARVFVNGKEVGNHPYGYTGFALDITDYVHRDGTTPNVIAVSVRNEVPSSRWYSGSGIYRHARIVVTDPVHVDRWGTFVTTPDLESDLKSGYATVDVRTTVVNEAKRNAAVTIVSRVIDADGAEVGAGRSSLAVRSGALRTGVTDIRVGDPTLWSTGRPYLYTLVTELYLASELVDVYETRFGIRHVEIDPELGLSINGEYTKIKGVNLHQDLGALGAAVSRDALTRQMRIMKSMGVNALRTAHNPPSPELLAVCEELGIVVMVEAFDVWERAKTAFDYARFFDQWARRDITEMVLAARNSPAVVLWSIGNEIRDPTVRTAERLVHAIEAVDDTRPIVWGSDGYRTLPEPGSGNDRLLRRLDGLGVNYNTARSIDALHARYPEKFLFESESSSSESTRGVYQQPEQRNTGENYTPGKRAVSSYDNNMAPWTMPAEYGLKKDRDRRFFAGEFLWSGFDYIGEPTPYFDLFPVKSSFFGAVDTAGFKKDLYWLFRSQWTADPMVHLVPMNWTDHDTGEEVEVWAYANVDTVELFLNGKSLGVRRFDHKVTTYGLEYLETSEATNDDKTSSSGSYTSPNGGRGKLHLTWTVPFEPGRLTAVGRKDGIALASDEVRTAGRPQGLRLTPDKRVVAAQRDALSFVTVEVIDAAGVVVPGASPRIDFEVAGGILAGLDNGRPESAEPYQGSSRTSFNGKALAILCSDGGKGAMTLRAKAEGLLPATTTIYEVPPGPGTVGDPEAVAGAGPVYVRARRGAVPTLPAEIEVVFRDGHTETRPVTWDSASPKTTTSFAGRISGFDVTAEAIVTRYDIAEIGSWTTTVPVGVTPMLPGTLRVGYSDGVSHDAEVVWDAVSPRSLAEPAVVSVSGLITELGLATRAIVTVSNRYAANRPLAGPESPLAVVADASYSGHRASVPANLIDGVISADSSWSNYYAKPATPVLPPFSAARPRDWVSLRWNGPQAIDTLVVHFAVSDVLKLPASASVSYWNGRSFVPVRNATIGWGDASRPTAITFEPVSTTQIRLEMISASPGAGDGFLGITELAVYGYALPRAPGSED